MYSGRGDGLTGIVETDRTVGGMHIDGESNHTLDLDANRLTIAGKLEMLGLDGMSNLLNMTIINGDLQLGTPGNPIDMEFGRERAGRPELVLAPSVTLHPYIRSITASGTGHRFPGVTIDLRGVKLAPEFNGKLSLDVLNLRSGMGGSTYLKLDDDTGIDTLEVLDLLGIAFEARENKVRIGDETNQWKLPLGMNVLVGNEAAGKRADLRIGVNSHSGASEGALTLNGGDFIAWLDNLDIGRDTENVRSPGELDLSEAGNVDIKAQTVMIGTTTGAGTQGEGIFKLAGGSVTGGNVTLGNRPWTPE